MPFKAFDPVPDTKARGGRRNNWAHPVVAGGRLYLRNQDEIRAYELRERPTP